MVPQFKLFFLPLLNPFFVASLELSLLLISEVLLIILTFPSIVTNHNVEQTS